MLRKEYMDFSLPSVVKTSIELLFLATLLLPRPEREECQSPEMRYREEDVETGVCLGGVSH